MQKLLKRIFITIGVIIGLLLITAIIIPVFFKDKIMVLVKKEMNEQLNAVADFKDVDISLFRSFPRLSVRIEGLSIVNIEPFKGDTLIAANSIDVAVDLMKALKGNYEILNIGLNTPRIHALVNEKGKANWDIAKPTPPSAPTESKPFAFSLRRYAIEDAYIEYRDEQGKMFAEIRNLNHSGSGDFTSDMFTLKTETKADAVSFTYGKIPYLVSVKTSADLDLEIDNKTHKYSFNTEKIQLNGLRLSSKGFVQLPDDKNTVMDVQFSTPSNDFKDILSLVPGVYQSSFKDIKTTGKLALSGFVKGTYNDKRMPAFLVNLAVNDASFQYPDLPQKVSNIQVKLLASNPDGVPDHTTLNIEKAHLEFGGAPFDLRLLLKTPISDPWIDAGAKGRLDLAQVEKFVKLEAGTKLTGLINADVSVKGNISAATKQQYEKLDAAGTVSINNLMYITKDQPDGININTLLLSFNPKNVTVAALKGRYMQTNFSGDGSINNMLAYYFHNEPLNGFLNIAVDKIDVNKWMGTAPATEKKEAAPATEPFAVPANLDFTLKASAGTVIYDNLTLSNVQSTVAIRDQAVYLENLSSNALEGTIKMNGMYSTKLNKRNPDIKFSYDVQSLDVQKSFTTFNTVQKLMPAAKYINGKVSTQFDMVGKLGSGMMPVMNSLTGKGNLLLLQGGISKFPALEKIADKLSITQLKNLSLKDVKIFFSFTNGRVTVEPYKINVGELQMQVAGSHGFDQTLQYGLNIDAPRSMLGAKGNAMVDDLVGKAAGKGMPVKLGEKINLGVKIGGTVTSPTVETDLKNVIGDAMENAKKQLMEEAKRRTDSLRKVAEDSINAVKTKMMQQAQQQMQKAKDSVARKAQELAGEAKRKADELANQAKKKAEDAANEAKRKAEEEAKKKLQEKGKDKLKDLLK